MSEFTSEDRNTLATIASTLDGHVKLTDERHKSQNALIADHEKRLRKNEGMLAKVSVVTGFISAGLTAGIVTVVRKFTG